MSRMTRRNFVKLAGGVTAAGMAGLSPGILKAGKGRVVVVGGGYAGAVAAKYIKIMDPGIEVTLVEKDKTYYSCPLSNWVVAGFRDIKAQAWTYDKLAKNHGITVIHDLATKIDPVAKKVTLKGGQELAADAIIVAPGVDFKWDAIEGYSAEVSDQYMPHAWKAGPQTVMLHNQLKAMKQGGLMVMVAPPNPYRCPPGPYERAALVAWYLKKHNPTAKLMILDPKDKFSKQGLFVEGWTKLYGYGTENSLIKWVPAGEGGKVVGVDGKNMIVKTELEEFKADVVNIIPPNIANVVARESGLTDDKGWCPVHLNTFESKLHAGVYVIGDSSAANGLPKSGYAANSEGKVVAAVVVARLGGQADPVPSYVNTCYSMLSPTYGISVAAVYKFDAAEPDKIKEVNGGVSPGGASDAFRAQEALYNESWYQSIMSDTFT